MEKEFPQSDEKVRALDSNACLTYLPKNSEIFHFRRITLIDVVKSIAKLKNSGSANIPTCFLKDASMCAASSLSVLFSKSLNEGVFPDNLKIARISAIYKGKGSRSNPDHYWPISILPVLARLFERLIHLQLYALMKDTLSKCQSGFKPEHSTETAFSTQPIAGQ